MSGQDPISFVKQFARELRNSNPKAWDGFLAAIDIYTTDITVAVTTAPTEFVLNAQGRAQQQRAFLACLTSLDPKTPQQPGTPGVSGVS